MSAPTMDSKKLHEPVVIGGNVRKVWKRLAGSDDYTTGGDAVSAVSFGLTSLLNVQFICIDGTKIAHPVFATAEPAKSVKMLVTNLAGTEASLHDDLSAKTFLAIAEGIT